MKYINTTPVSGCKKVRIEGIAKITKDFNININPPLTVGLS